MGFLYTRKFTYLPAVHICVLVSKKGSPVAAYSGKSLPTSRHNLSVPSSRFKNIADKCVHNILWHKRV